MNTGEIRIVGTGRNTNGKTMWQIELGENGPVIMVSSKELRRREAAAAAKKGN